MYILCASTRPDIHRCIYFEQVHAHTYNTRRHNSKHRHTHTESILAGILDKTIFTVMGIFAFHGVKVYIPKCIFCRAVSLLPDMAASVAQAAKRAFVAVLLALARQYGVDVGINRDSKDELLEKTFKKVVCRAHPDKGGTTEDAQKHHSARDEWRKLRGKAPGRKPNSTPQSSAEAIGGQLFRIQSVAIMLTYQGVADLDQWVRFLAFVGGNLAQWGVCHWCATLETCKSGLFHIHLMLQFLRSRERSVDTFFFEGLKPNASTNDLCGEGRSGRNPQQSIDRGFFYVFADKIGTVRTATGSTCTAGNYLPAWTESPMNYQVLGKWPETLWKKYKVTDRVYEELLFLSRDGVSFRKRNLDACRDRAAKQVAEGLLQERVKRIRGNTEIYKPFPVVPEAQAWLQLFLQDALRYPIMVVFGPSRAGKTEWAKSLFQNALELKIGTLEQFPDRMREFSRDIHDGIVLDDVRDLEFLVSHQDKLQGKYDSMVEFGSTAGGTCAYHKDLFAIPFVVTVNRSTANLGYLLNNDWLGNTGNRVYIEYTGFA
jgi:hypothetical protein